jgi:hypothetical protein
LSRGKTRPAEAYGSGHRRESDAKLSSIDHASPALSHGIAQICISSVIRSPWLGR